MERNALGNIYMQVTQSFVDLQRILSMMTSPTTLPLEHSYILPTPPSKLPPPSLPLLYHDTCLYLLVESVRLDATRFVSLLRNVEKDLVVNGMITLTNPIILMHPGANG